MPADTDAPILILHGIIDADVARVTLRFHCVAPQCARARGGVAGAHKDGVSGVAEMICACVLAGLWSARMTVVGRNGEAQAGRSEGFARCFEGRDGEAKGQAEHATYGAAEGVAREPDVGIWVKLCDVSVKLGGGLIVPVFPSEGSGEAGLVAGESGRRAVADLFPEVVAPLTAAAAEEEVVIDFISCGGASAVEDRRSGALQGDYDGFVAFVGEDVATETIAFPAEAVGVVEARGDVFPFAAALGVLVVRVCCHYGKVDDGFFVGDIRTGDFIERPG